MSTYRRGERVSNIVRLDPGVRSSIPAGTVGVVRDVEGGTWLAGRPSYEVRFPTGHTMWLHDEHLEPA